MQRLKWVNLRRAASALVLVLLLSSLVGTAWAGKPDGAGGGPPDGSGGGAEKIAPTGNLDAVSAAPASVVQGGLVAVSATFSNLNGTPNTFHVVVSGPGGAGSNQTNGQDQFNAGTPASQQVTFAIPADATLGTWCVTEVSLQNFPGSDFSPSTIDFEVSGCAASFVVTPSAPADTTPPTVTASRSPEANGAGWNNTSVTVTAAGTDSGSGIASCTTVTVSTEGANQSATVSCTDNAGNSASVTVSGINIDMTAPTLNPLVSPSPVVLNGSATVSANASDGLSGLATSGCGAVDASSVGSKTVSCTAADNAGNSANAIANYSVVYKFGGFLQPVLVPVQTFKAGSTIPVKFRLQDANGKPVTTAKATLTNNGGLFRYDASGDLYIYNLSTKGMATGSLTLTVSLDDGTTQSVAVTLK